MEGLFSKNIGKLSFFIQLKNMQIIYTAWKMDHKKYDKSETAVGLNDANQIIYLNIIIIEPSSWHADFVIKMMAAVRIIQMLYLAKIGKRHQRVYVQWRA